MINVGNERLITSSNINDCLIKSFDNIMFQQTKMDHKAFIFIGFLSTILGLINKNFFQNEPTTWILIITLIPLIVSLIPVATKSAIFVLNKVVRNKINDSHNIFYYIDLYRLTEMDFVKILDTEYDIKNINKIESKLIEQILINSKILYLKVFWQNLALNSFAISFLILWVSKLITRLTV